MQRNQNQVREKATLFAWTYTICVSKRAQCACKDRYAPILAVLGSAWLVLFLSQAKALEGDLAAADSLKESGGGLPTAWANGLQSNAASLSTATISTEVAREWRNEPGGRPVTRRGSEKTFGYFDDGRFYHRLDTVINRRDGTQVRRYSETSFDLQVVYYGSVNEGKIPILSKFLGENPAGTTGPPPRLDDPYLDAAGFEIPELPTNKSRNMAIASTLLEALRSGQVEEARVAGSVAKVRLRVSDPDVLRAKQFNMKQFMANERAAHADPADTERELAAIQRLQAMEPFRRIEFTLDPAKNYAVTHRDDFSGDGRRTKSVECSEFEFFAERNLWMPRLCVIKDYDLSSSGAQGIPLLTMNTRLTDLSFSKREDISFTLKYDKPGSIIADMSTAEARTMGGGQVTGVVGATGEILRESAESARGEFIPWRNWVIIANVVFLVVLAIAMVVRQRRLSQKSRANEASP